MIKYEPRGHRITGRILPRHIATRSGESKNVIILGSLTVSVCDTIMKKHFKQEKVNLVGKSRQHEPKAAGHMTPNVKRSSAYIHLLFSFSICIV